MLLAGLGMLSLLACRKDRAEFPLPATVAADQSTVSKYPITLLEAATWFSLHRSVSSGLVSGTAFLDLDPVWDQAF